MPKGTERPYNKSERQIAAAEKRLRNATNNRAAREEYGSTSRTRGRTIGMTDGAGSASSSYRATSRDIEKTLVRQAKRVQNKKAAKTRGGRK